MNPLTVVDAVATTDNSASWMNRFTLSFVNTDLSHSMTFLNMDPPFYTYTSNLHLVITVLVTTHSTASVALE